MPENNPGFDLVATDIVTGEILYVEVKGDSLIWSEKGAGISKRQYVEAEKCGASYLLAFVDNLAHFPSKPIYIKNPVSLITEYRFDSGWAAIAVNLKSLSNSSEGYLNKLIELTENLVCKEIIKYCDDMSHPLPDVGAAIQNERGAIIADDIELLWELEKVIIVIDLEQLEFKFKDDWKVIAAYSVVEIKLLLDITFNDIIS